MSLGPCCCCKPDSSQANERDHAACSMDAQLGAMQLELSQRQQELSAQREVLQHKNVELAQAVEVAATLKARLCRLNAPCTASQVSVH